VAAGRPCAAGSPGPGADQGHVAAAIGKAGIVERFLQRLARRHLVATHHPARLFSEFEQDRQKFHGVLRSRSRAGSSP